MERAIAPIRFKFNIGTIHKIFNEKQELSKKPMQGILIAPFTLMRTISNAISYLWGIEVLFLTFSIVGRKILRGTG